MSKILGLALIYFKTMLDISPFLTTFKALVSLFLLILLLCGHFPSVFYDFFLQVHMCMCVCAGVYEHMHVHVEGRD